jgi:hypothetical protein
MVLTPGITGSRIYRRSGACRCWTKILCHCLPLTGINLLFPSTFVVVQYVMVLCLASPIGLSFTHFAGETPVQHEGKVDSMCAMLFWKS